MNSPFIHHQSLRNLDWMAIRIFFSLLAISMTGLISETSLGFAKSDIYVPASIQIKKELDSCAVQSTLVCSEIEQSEPVVREQKNHLLQDLNEDAKIYKKNCRLSKEEQQNTS